MNLRAGCGRSWVTTHLEGPAKTSNTRNMETVGFRV